MIKKFYEVYSMLFCKVTSNLWKIPQLQLFNNIKQNLIIISKFINRSFMNLIILMNPNLILSKINIKSNVNQSKSLNRQRNIYNIINITEK